MRIQRAAPYIRVHERDNVAIVIDSNGLRAGTQLPSGLTLRDSVPQAHKIALTAIEPGEPIVRYGHTIGFAKHAIGAGSWLREDSLEAPPPPSLDELPLATATPAPQPALTGHTFEGFRNPNGSVGTKNILGITTTVQCVAPTVDYAVRRIKNELLPRFPNVDDAVAITHTYGCGVALEVPGAEIPIRTLRHIGTHPNLGAAPLIVSLGCEKLQPDRLFPNHNLARLPVLESDPLVVRMQDERGFAEVVAAILRAAEKRLSGEYLGRAATDRTAKPTPGNKRGGLANVVEKALGSIAKAGTSALAAVASHGERVTTKGLVFAATPASDFICGTQQLASMNVHVFTTGEGSPYGLAMVPVIKVSSRTALAERWADLIDIDAGRIATGNANIDDLVWIF